MGRFPQRRPYSQTVNTPYGHIFRNVVPLMRRKGFTEDEIDNILVHTPRRLLTFV